MKRNLTLALLLTSAIIAPQFASAESIKIGVLATFEGPFTVLGEGRLVGPVMKADLVGPPFDGGKELAVVDEFFHGQVPAAAAASSC